MEYSDLTRRQVERAIGKIAAKFPTPDDDIRPLTDIHLRINPETGELLAFDDDDNEVNRCVINEWINSTNEDFYTDAAQFLRDTLRQKSDVIDAMGILKPFSVVLEDEDKEPIGELYLADDDTVILGGDIMNGLDKDLDNFLESLHLE